MIINDKIILMFYVVFGMIFVIGLLYIDSTFDKNNVHDILPKEITELVIKRELIIDKQDLFLVFQDLKNYHLVLPKNVLNIQVINMTENTFFTKSTIREGGIKTTMTLKHQFEPYSKYKIYVMDGDAKGTIIEQTFEGNSTQTNLTTKINFKLKGIFTSFLFFPKQNISHAVNTVIDEFVLYSETNSNKYHKTIDDLYREVLYRSVDPEGLSHYSILLHENKITSDEIKQELLKSDEAKISLNPTEIMNVEELRSVTVEIVNSLYEKILFRPVDPEGLQHFGSLLEAGKISENQLEEILSNSDEKKLQYKALLKSKIMQVFSVKSSNDVPFYQEFNFLEPNQIKNTSDLNSETINSVNIIYHKVFNHEVDDVSLKYFGSLLEAGKISENQLEEILSKKEFK
jgi:hypothetical protein